MVGFPGGTQVLAGVHVLWLTLAARLVGRPGAATISGVLKGAVEMLSGSPHGLFVVLISGVAGVIVDLVLLVSRGRMQTMGVVVGAALAAASNVVLFQLFASLPSHHAVLTTVLVLSGIAGAKLIDVGRLAAGWPLRRF